jgi:hypothetical protein
LLIEQKTPKQPNQKQLFLESLLPEFSRKDCLITTKRLQIPDKTAEKHNAKFTRSSLITLLTTNTRKHRGEGQ